MYSPPLGYRTPGQPYSNLGYGAQYLPALLGPTVRVLPGGISAPPNPIPGLSPVAWFNGDNQAWQDLAGTVPASLGQSVARVNETAPLTSNFQVPTLAQRLTANSNSVNFDYFGPSTPAHAIQRANLATALNLNNSTLIISFMPRDADQGPLTELLQANSSLGGSFGMYGAGTVFIDYNAGTNWVTSTTYSKAVKTTLALVSSPTGLKLFKLVGSTITSESLPVAVTPGLTTGALRSALSPSGLYAAISQMVAFNTALSDSLVVQAMQWTHSRPLPEAYPIASRLFGVLGDSIPRGTVGVNSNEAYCWKCLQDIRATYPDAQMANGAILGGGAGLPNYTIAPYYSASRARNIAMLQVGTNDLANANSVASTLAALYAECDAIRATGWKLIASTILPRSGLFGGVTQAQFNTAMTAYNNDILANWHLHADALWDTTTIAGMGAIGDSTNLINYLSDGVHPTAVGMGLLYPTLRNQFLALAA